ncbi:MAG: BTAD domain-containing putative transcriptional regulator [Caldilineaceae bacterium]
MTQQTQSRDTLADLLWSETNNQQARTNLRYLLPELRKKVGAYLSSTAHTLRFNRQQPYWLDVESFSTTIAPTLTAVDTPTLQAAVDLYQGEFLAGFSVRNAPVFEEWLTVQREALHQTAVQGLYVLTERYLIQGNSTAGLATVQRLLHLDPWHEAGHRLQMQLLAATGQRSVAIAHYHQLRHQLADELGADLSTETRNLYMELIGAQPAEEPGRQLPAHATAVLTPGQTKDVASADTTPLLSLPRHNLPAPLTPFIGRQQEIPGLYATLLEPENRLVTLAGEGGVGKTRLALTLGQQVIEASAKFPECRPFADGVWFVPLSGVTAGNELTDALAVAVAQAVGLQFSGSQPLLQQLLAQLHKKALLLLLDNAEHLLPGIADFLCQILQHCSHITILVTSRHVLNLQAELVWPVAGLPVPTDEDCATLEPAAFMTYGSIALFVERANRIQRSFQLTPENAVTVAAICRHVAGLPLAIELAAANIRQYRFAELRDALQHDYTILSTTFADLPPRQQSMRAMLEYSWRFLTQDEAKLLAACAMFSGGFTSGAAQAVTGIAIAVLQKLVDQSLLQVHHGRFLLHELVRQYAAAQLAKFPAYKQRIAAAHAVYYIDLSHSLEGALLVHFDAQQKLQQEFENICAAWRWSVEQGDLALLAKGLESLYSFYRLAGRYREAIQSFASALTVVRHAVAVTPTATSSWVLLARLLCHSAEFYRRTDSVEMGERLGQEALALGQRLADPALQGLAYHRLARLAYMCSDFGAMCERAEAGYQQANQTADPHLRAECLNDLGLANSACTGPLTALPHFHQALAMLQGAANHVLEAFVLANLGFSLMAACRYQAAHTYLQQGLALQHQLQDRGGRLSPLIHLGNLWTAVGAYGEAQTVFAEALALVQKSSGPYWESWLYTSYGRWQQLSGDPSAARAACLHARQMAQQGGMQLQEQWALVYLGHALVALAEHDAASACYQQAIALHKTGSWLHRTADAHAGLATLLLSQNQVADAIPHIEAALTSLTQYGLAGAAEPFTVYWTAVHGFAAAADARATIIVRTAYQQLQTIAAQFTDASWQRSFLEDVIVNRHLLTAAQNAGVIQ